MIPTAGLSPPLLVIGEAPGLFTKASMLGIPVSAIFLSFLSLGVVRRKTKGFSYTRILLQLLIILLRRDQNRIVGVGVFPKRKKIFIGLARFGVIAGQRGCLSQPHI